MSGRTELPPFRLSIHRFGAEGCFEKAHVLRFLGRWIINREDYSWSECFPLPYSGKIRADPTYKDRAAQIVGHILGSLIGP